MQQGIESILNRHPWISSCFIVLLFYLLFNFSATPIINSGDDTYLMYTLAGGYGDEPSHLLHYNHIWHPVLGWLVKILFTSFPGINWYTLLLSLFHIAGCSAILYVLIKKLNPLLAILFYLVIFLFIETRLLLHFNFTGAALVAAGGALCLLLYQLQFKKFMQPATILAIILLIFAGLLRLQIVWLSLFLYSSIVITLLNKQQLIRWAAVAVFVVISLFGLNKWHEHYYTMHIPGWEQQEKFRQALFYSYNRQLVNNTAAAFTDSTEQQLFFAGFLYDSVKFNTKRVKDISQQITRTRSLANKEDRSGLYWFFIEMRLYVLLFAVIIISLLLHRRFIPLRNWLLSFLAYFAVHSYLFLYLKMTAAIHFGMLLFLFLALALQFKKGDILFTANKKIAFLLSLVLLVLFGWMGARIAKENEKNEIKYQRFLCASKELNADPDKLFVATDDSFPLNYFYIWNIPTEFPATNLLYKDRLITHTYLQTLKRFNITNLDEALLKNKNVYLLGLKLPALEKGKISASLSDTLPGYKCIEVRQLQER